MASKFGLAGGIPERRVRPIWDAVDSRQFKNALKHCTTLLSKYPNSPYALALKALVLERMGKTDEAFSVCLNAKDLLYTNDTLLIDDLTLSTLQIVFQRLHHLDMATSCYEYACAKFPNNLDLMMGLFNCYVREYSFVKQQQIAIKMYKIVGEERFLLWAVCSIQLQVLCGNGGEKLLLLAEGLLKKHIASHSLHEPEALIVYISLLEQQSKYGDALELLTGKLGSLIMTEVDRLRLQGRLLARGGDYAAAASVFQKVLELCPDDWECFLHYLGCLLEDDSSLCKGAHIESAYPLKSMDSQVSHLTDEAFGSRLSNASSLVQKLLKEASNDTVRCPYLANVEIERRKLVHGKGDADKLMEALVQYFLRFGHLACFASDVEVFLHNFDDDSRAKLLKKLTKSCESIPTNNPRKTLGQYITVYKIQDIVGSMFTLPINELETTAVKMTSLYFESLPLSKDLDAQESMYGEDLLSMVCNLLVQLFWRTRHIGYLVESIMILEFGLTVRRHIWQYKVLLLHLYSHWNSLPLAYEWYKTLDVKNILLETVSHHILPQMLASPLWADSTDILRDYLRFMDDHFRESADLTFLAYRHRSYSKVIEFVQFKERLQKSSQYLMAKIETPILQLKQKASNIEEEEGILESLKHGVQFVELSDEIGSNSPTFNEELQLRPWWTPTYDNNYLLGPFEGLSCCNREALHDQIKLSQAKVVKTIEKRSLLPRMVYLSIQCASSSVRESVEANGSVVDPKLSSELRVLLGRYASMLGFSFQDAVGLAFDISSGLKDPEAWSCNLIDWMNFIVFLNAWNLYSHEVDRDSNRQGTWLLVNSILKKYILDKVRSMGPLESSPGCDLSNLVLLVTEPLAWHILVIQSCARSLVPSGKRKKKGGPSDHCNVQLSQEVRNSVYSVCETIELVTKWLNQQISKPDDEKSDSILSSVLKDGEEGPGKVYGVLETLISSSTRDADLGDRITRALQSWSPADIARKIISGQRTALSNFLRICDLKIKSLQELKALL